MGMPKISQNIDELARVDLHCCTGWNDPKCCEYCIDQAANDQMNERDGTTLSGGSSALINSQDGRHEKPQAADFQPDQGLHERG